MPQPSFLFYIMDTSLIQQTSDCKDLASVNAENSQPSASATEVISSGFTNEFLIYFGGNVH